MGNTPPRLGSVHHEQQAVSLGNGPDFSDVQQIPRQIGAVGADDGSCVIPNRGRNGIAIDSAPVIGGQNGQLYAPVFQLIQGPQNGVVLHSGGNNVITGVQDTLDGSVQGSRCIGGKGDICRILPVKQLSKGTAGLVNRPRSRQGRLVHSPSRVAEGAHGLYHRPQNALRLLQRCRRVVEIDHRFP